MLCEYLHTKSESLAQMRTIMAKYSIFSRGLFFIGAPCINVAMTKMLLMQSFSGY